MNTEEFNTLVMSFMMRAQAEAEALEAATPPPKPLNDKISFQFTRSPR